MDVDQLALQLQNLTPEQALDVMRGLELAVASSHKRCVLPWHAQY